MTRIEPLNSQPNGEINETYGTVIIILAIINLRTIITVWFSAMLCFCDFEAVGTELLETHQSENNVVKTLVSYCCHNRYQTSCLFASQG